MDNQPLNGVFVVYLKDLGKFLRPLHAHPGLDGNGNGAAAENLRQAIVQRAQIQQHPRSLVLGHHRAGGAADVQVHFLIAQPMQLLRHPEKGLRPVHQQLGDEADSLVVFRQNIPQGAGLELAAAVRGDEGREVFLHAAEKPGVGLPVYAGTDPFHRGETELHLAFSLFFYLLYRKRRKKERRKENPSEFFSIYT